MITTTPTSTACWDPIATYYPIFPGLPTFGWQNKDDLNNSSQLTRKRRHSIFTSARLDHSWIPPYLFETHYAALVREQHQTMFQKRIPIDKESMNDTTLQQQYTCINTDTSGRLVTLDLRLPSVMNSADKSRYLDIDTDGLGVNYIGPGRSEDHAGTVRANLPIPIQCGVYYYEMHVKSKGDDGYIGIGFCSARNELKRLPGWDKLSFGYHGDDGHKFEGSGIGKKYGPQFQSGDVIGCGVDFANKCAFYTKNGAFLGVAFQQLDLSLPIFPCIGMRTHGEYVTVNFGQDPFVYDIIQYIQEQKMALWKDITSYSIPTSATLTISQPESTISDKENRDPNMMAEHSNNTSPTMDQLILSYMIHHGYSDSAAALKKNSVYLSERNHNISMDDNDDDFLQRLSVKKAIGRGDIDHAIELIRLYFPSVLSNNKDSILFQLKCQKFVEMIGNDDTSTKNQQQQQQQQQHSLESDDEMVTLSSSSSSSSSSDSQRYLENQDHGGVNNNNNESSTKRQESTTEPDVMDMDDETSISSLEYERMESIMTFGQEIQDEFGQNASPIMADKLKQVFSLLAYPDPSSSPMGHLLAKFNREELASQVNVAILVNQNRPKIPALDSVYRQLLMVNKELTYLGHGHSAFLDLSQE